MEVSVFSLMDGPPERRSPADRVGSFLRLAETADRLGLAGVWVAEHHFGPTGGCPNPAILLAAVSQRTRRLRLGPLVSVLPFHSPVEIAESYALVDRLSRGRLRFGVGSGYLPAEFEGFGVDPATKRERFEAALETIRAGWIGRSVRDSPRARPVRVHPRPAQRPHPPIWVAVQQAAAVEAVARQGDSVAVLGFASSATDLELSHLARRFHAARPAGGRARFGVALHVYGGPAPARARRALQRHLDARAASRGPFILSGRTFDPRRIDGRDLEARGGALIGDPARLRQRLGDLEALGVDELIAIVDFGGLEPRDSESTLPHLARAAGGTDPAGERESTRIESLGSGHLGGGEAGVVSG